MDELLKGPLIDFIIGQLGLMSGGAAFDMTLDPLSQDMQGYNGAAFHAARFVAETFVRPVASVLLSLILVVELARSASRMEQDGQMGVRMIAGVLFKYIVLILIVQHSSLILQAIAEIAQHIIAQFNATYGGPSAPSTGDALANGLKEHLDKADLGQVLLVAANLAIPAFVSLIAGGLAWAMVAFRFLEMYLLSAFAPLPMALFGNSDTKQIPVGYLRSFAAAALQGATLIIGLFVLSQLQVGAMFSLDLLDKGVSIETWVSANIVPMWGGALLQIMVILGAHKVAKQIVGQA